MEKLPDDLKSIGVIMSNFDYDIAPGTEQKLKNEPVYGEYTARNFWGAVWFANGVFKCMVKQYREHVSTISAMSLHEIMQIACDRYGSG